MLRVGLTGGIAAGKSTVASRLAQLGAVVVDADALSHDVLAPGTSGARLVRSTFGESFVDAEGVVDRAALGTLVFSDYEARRRLESITHPQIQELTAARFADAPADSILVHEIPLLVELDLADRYHLVLIVHAPEAERVARLVTGRGMTEVDAWARVHAQADDTARRAAADVWLDNTAAPDALIGQVDTLWHGRLVPFEAGIRGREPAVPTHDSVTANEPTTATVRRLTARVRRALGDLAAGVTSTSRGPSSASSPVATLSITPIELAVVVATTTHEGQVDDALGDAGFPRATGPEWVHRSADPGCAVDIAVRRQG